MKLTDYIKEHHSGNIAAFALTNNYHVTQVKRYLAQDAVIEDGEVSFKKILQEKK